MRPEEVLHYENALDGEDILDGEFIFVEEDEYFGVWGYLALLDDNEESRELTRFLSD